jgi:hypothetical protein
MSERGADGRFLPKEGTEQESGGGVAVLDKDEEIRQLRKELRAAHKAAERKQAELDELKPTIDLHSRLFETTEDVYNWFEEQQLKDMAEQSLVAENRLRQRRGLSRLEYTEEEWAQAIEDVVEDLLADRVLNGAPEEGPLMRVIKMWNPADQSIREIPYEGQFNNIAGSLADGLVTYQRKGFKQIEPMLCAAGGCNQVAARQAAGKNQGRLQFAGYCSQDHFDRTEKRNNAELPGVVNRTSVTAPNN